MFDNLGLIAAVIILLWLVSLGLYLYASRQHSDLQKDIEALKRSLDEDVPNDGESEGGRQ